MALAQLMAGQRRGQQQQRRCLGVEVGEEMRQGTIQLTQPVAFAPGRQQLEQGVAIFQH